MSNKKSFFERLTGTVRLDDEEYVEEKKPTPISTLNKTVAQTNIKPVINNNINVKEERKEEEKEGQLTVDVYETREQIVIRTMVAGVHPEDLDISISRDSVTIRGKREEERTVDESNYFARELYWGAFSRTIALPEEVNVDEAEAIERHGLLIIKLPKLDQGRQTKLKVKTV